jgi:hypothetical protein
VSIRAVAEDLGHNDPGFTRRVYAHLMPLDVVEVCGRRADLRPVLGTLADQEGRYSTLVITGQARWLSRAPDVRPGATGGEPEGFLKCLHRG